jgi:ATP-dependent DNA ligase
MLSGDLTGTAEVALAEGVAGLRGIGFEPFRPILTMPASTAESVGKAVASFDRASVEWKLDGIRIQLHRRGDEVRVYTRNLNEITHALPGSPTPYAASRSSRPFSTTRRCGWASGDRRPSRRRSRRSTVTRRRREL